MVITHSRVLPVEQPISIDSATLGLGVCVGVATQSGQGKHLAQYGRPQVSHGLSRDGAAQRTHAGARTKGTSVGKVRSPSHTIPVTRRLFHVISGRRRSAMVAKIMQNFVFVPLLATTNKLEVPQTVLALRGSHGVGSSSAHGPGHDAETLPGSRFPCILPYLVTFTLDAFLASCLALPCPTSPIFSLFEAS